LNHDKRIFFVSTKNDIVSVNFLYTYISFLFQ